MDATVTHFCGSPASSSSASGTMDPLTRLAPVIGRMCLMYLDIRTLIRCHTVNRHWLSFLSTSVISLVDPVGTSVSGGTAGCIWRSIAMRMLADDESIRDQWLTLRSSNRIQVYHMKPAAVSAPYCLSTKDLPSHVITALGMLIESNDMKASIGMPLHATPSNKTHIRADEEGSHVTRGKDLVAPSSSSSSSLLSTTPPPKGATKSYTWKALSLHLWCRGLMRLRCQRLRMTLEQRASQREFDSDDEHADEYGNILSPRPHRRQVNSHGHAKPPNKTIYPPSDLPVVRAPQSNSEEEEEDTGGSL
jgi:hypothetical protein